MVVGKGCKDCAPDRSRPTPHPGPRCATHHREAVKARKAAAAERRNQKVYGLAPGDYDRLYEIQGGTCAICLRARGISKRLAVDHDHSDGRVRGLLCSVCNSMIAHARDDAAFFLRAYIYLKDPPSRLLLTAMIQEKWDAE